jgi:hypothetical protein
LIRLKKDEKKKESIVNEIEEGEIRESEIKYFAPKYEFDFKKPMEKKHLGKRYSIEADHLKIEEETDNQTSIFEENRALLQGS